MKIDIFPILGFTSIFLNLLYYQENELPLKALKLKFRHHHVVFPLVNINFGLFFQSPFKIHLEMLSSSNITMFSPPLKTNFFISRYWVVFSVHDDTIPFLELWTEPTEVASKPPQFMFPLAVCQHISPSLVPAGDHEWTFVVNFETVAIRFSCNSR